MMLLKNLPIIHKGLWNFQADSMVGRKEEDILKWQLLKLFKESN